MIKRFFEALGIFAITNIVFGISAFVTLRFIPSLEVVTTIVLALMIAWCMATVFAILVGCNLIERKTEFSS